MSKKKKRPSKKPRGTSKPKSFVDSGARFGNVWSVTGQRGVGKTYLLDQLAERYPNVAVVKRDAVQARVNRVLGIDDLRNEMELAKRGMPTDRDKFSPRARRQLVSRLKIVAGKILEVLQLPEFERERKLHMRNLQEIVNASQNETIVIALADKDLVDYMEMFFAEISILKKARQAAHTKDVVFVENPSLSLRNERGTAMAAIEKYKLDPKLLIVRATRSRVASVGKVLDGEPDLYDPRIEKWPVVQTLDLPENLRWDLDAVMENVSSGDGRKNTVIDFYSDGQDVELAPEPVKEQPESFSAFDVPEVKYTYEELDVPLVAYEGPRNGAVPIDNDEREALMDFVRWKSLPPFAEMGRSSFVARKEMGNFGGIDVAAYKLKGVANCDSDKGTVILPSDDTYMRTISINTKDVSGYEEMKYRALSMMPQILVHMGITDTGGFRPVPDPAKPLGGMPSGRGQAEFENARTLCEAGVSACSPITWGIYPDLKWDSKPMEFVVLGLPTNDPRRIGNAFEMERGLGFAHVAPYMKELLAKRFDSFNPAKAELPALRLTSEMAFEMGKTLRKAHESGVCRFAGHTGNYSYLPDKRTVLMHDFDSSVKVSSLSKDAVLLSLLRDVDSLISGLMASVGHAHLYNLVGNDERFKAKNPFVAALRGYFGTDNPQAVAELELILDWFNKFTIDLLKMRGENPMPEQQNLWLYNAQTQLNSTIFQLLFETFAKSDLCEHFGVRMPGTRDGLVANLEQFLTDRMRVAQEKGKEEFDKLPQWAQEILRLEGILL